MGGGGFSRLQLCVIICSCTCSCDRWMGSGAGHQSFHRRWRATRRSWRASTGRKFWAKRASHTCNGPQRPRCLLQRQRHTMLGRWGTPWSHPGCNDPTSMVLCSLIKCINGRLGTPCGHMLGAFAKLMTVTCKRHGDLHKTAQRKDRAVESAESCWRGAEGVHDGPAQRHSSAHGHGGSQQGSRAVSSARARCSPCSASTRASNPSQLHR